MSSQSIKENAAETSIVLIAACGGLLIAPLLGFAIIAGIAKPVLLALVYTPLVLLLCLIGLSLFSNYIDSIDQKMKSGSIKTALPFYFAGIASLVIFCMMIHNTGGIYNSPFLWILEYYVASTLYLSVLAGPKPITEMSNRRNWLRKYRCLLFSLAFVFVAVIILYLLGEVDSIEYSSSWRLFFAIYGIAITVLLYPLAEFLAQKRLDIKSGKNASKSKK